MSAAYEKLPNALPRPDTCQLLQWIVFFIVWGNCFYIFTKITIPNLSTQVYKAVRNGASKF